MWLQHVDLGGSKDEVAETAVHWLLKVEVVEWFDEMGPVQVRVDSEHLTEDGLADIDELLRETTALANPVTRACKLREGGVQGGWTSRDRSVGARGIEATGGVGSACDLRVADVVGEGNTSGVSGEDVGVVGLAGDPSLHERDVFMGRDLNRLSAGVQPGE